MNAYEITTDDGVTYLVDAADERDAYRVARTHLRDNLPHINPAQGITITPLAGHGIPWRY